MKKILFMVGFILAMGRVYALTGQTGKADEFDFWVGEWDLYWGDSLRGSNTITREQNGRVIHEKFADQKGFTGESWSVYSTAEQKWKQTWVDNSGAYISLTGEFGNNGMELYSEKTVNGKKVKLKMHYKNITADAFDWEWSSLTEGEKTWKVNWAIHYKRKDKNVLADQAYLQQQFAKGKNYFLVLYEKGPQHDKMDSVAVQKNQMAHVQHLFTLHRQGKLNVFGPVLQESPLLGICIFNVQSKDELVKLVEKDPAIAEGRVSYKILPWFSIQGYMLE